MPFGGSGDRRTRALRLRPLLDAQLRFARALAAARGEGLETALTHYTNFHRRFGYGIVGRHAPAAGWLAFLDDARRARDQRSLVDVAAEHFARGTEEQPLPHQAYFGCFSYSIPEADGSVRIHFFDRDPPEGPGPLSAVRIGRRRAELARLTASLRREYPGARCIRGKSWLYHLEAYRRLFPPAYIADREIADEGLSFRGSGCWGQLQKRAGIDAGACEAFVARLPALDAEFPWRVFPLVPMTVSASISAFAEHYGVEEDACTQVR